MKKFTFAALLISSMAITACHYGENEAHDTIERNELYKTDKADYSVNRAGEGGKHEAVKAEVPATDTTAKAATEAAPATEATHSSH